MENFLKKDSDFKETEFYGVIFSALVATFLSTVNKCIPLIHRTLEFLWLILWAAKFLPNPCMESKGER